MVCCGIKIELKEVNPEFYVYYFGRVISLIFLVLESFEMLFLELAYDKAAAAWVRLI